MERMEALNDPGLCLQDLVSGVSTSSANDGHLHGSSVHHHLHDSVAAAVSVSSAITGIMSSSSASMLGHHHVSPHHDVSVSHGVVPHTPALHHEPLEKLKRGESHFYWGFFFFINLLLYTSFYFILFLFSFNNLLFNDYVNHYYFFIEAFH